MLNNQQVLTITKLNKTFKSNHVLKDLTCTLEQGKVYGLIGKNGAGKTTLIKCIIGALLIDSGEILINNISNQKTKAKSPIAYIPEKNTFPNEYNAKQFLSHIAIIKGNNKVKTKTIVNNILQQYDFVNMAKINPNKLSSGMQKQLMIDAMLIDNPNIIIMDEPTVNLDPNNRFAFFTKIKSFKEANKTVIISSHILDELATVADEFLILDEGKITTKEFINKNDNFCVIKTFTKDDFTKLLHALENKIVQIIKTDKANNEAILQLKLNIKIQDINYVAYQNKITLAKCEKYQNQISDIYHIFDANKSK